MDGSKDNLNNEGNFLSSHIILGFHAVANGYDLERVCKSIVWNDLDHMGLLLKAKLVPEKDF